MQILGRQRVISSVVAAACLLAGTAFAQTPPPKQPLAASVMMEHASSPFGYLGPDGKPSGFAVALLQAIARDQNLDLRFDLRPWQQVYDDFRAGRGDILGLVAYSEDRAEKMDFSVPFETLYCGTYIAEDSPDIITEAQLHGLRIAVIHNAITHEFVRSQTQWNAKVVTYDTLAQCLDAVRTGRADLALGMNIATDHIIRQNAITGVKRTVLEIHAIDYQLCYAVQRGDARLLARLNTGLANMRANGTYDQLYERWLGPLQPRRLRWSDVRPYAVPAGALLALIVAVLVLQRWMLARVSRHAQALRESEERLSLVFEGSQDGFWDWNTQQGTVLRSPRWFGILGYEPGEIPPDRKSFLSLIHPDDRQTVVDDEREIWGHRDDFRLEFRMRAKSGEWKWILDRGKVVARDPVTREPLRIAGTHTDITPGKRAEEESALLHRRMQETQRLESLGVLAGGIAHDFNNLLTVILGNASLVRLDRHTTSDARGRIEKITTAANRAADLCRQLLAYAGKGAFTLERLQLDQVVRDTTHLLELSLSPRAKLEFDLSPDTPPVEADPSQMQQIIMNLVLNASEALGENSGRIRLVASRVELVRGELSDALPAGDLPAGTYARLEVSDNGCGMTPEVRTRIFDPFFTTKFTGRGLGLAAVLGIVRAHRGALTVRTNPGEGTTFRIYLPAASAGNAPSKKNSAQAFQIHPAGTYLVVDDEAAVRALLAEMLAHSGHQAVPAPDGASAVEIFRTQPTRFNAALLDLTMPGLDGHGTLQGLRQIRPDLPCILLSGYSESDVRSRPNAGAFTAFLQKPFTPESLNECLLRCTKGP